MAEQTDAGVAVFVADTIGWARFLIMCLEKSPVGIFEEKGANHFF